MSRTSDAGRDLALDFAKGALVVVMVIYHAMNILSTAGPEDFQHIRFVSGSFIFLSGYVVARFHFERFRADRMGTTGRLLQRGCKLALLFTALNLLIHLTGIGNPGKTQMGILQYAGNLTDIYIFGDSRYASFQILLPIAYLLMLSPAVLLLGGTGKTRTLALLAMAFACTLVPIESPHWEFSVLGIIGLAAGMLEDISGKPFSTANSLLAAVGLAACIGLMGFFSRHLATYALGIAIITKLLYDLGKAARLPQTLVQALVLLGEYSLPCYLAQIAILRILFIGLAGERLALGVEMAMFILATTALLLGLCLSLALLRERYHLVHRSYKLIFS
jgi:hypothetical protein